jgi:hypothetical protein
VPRARVEGPAHLDFGASCAALSDRELLGARRDQYEPATQAWGLGWEIQPQSVVHDSDLELSVGDYGVYVDAPGAVRIGVHDGVSDRFGDGSLMSSSRCSSTPARAARPATAIGARGTESASAGIGGLKPHGHDAVEAPPEYG